MKPDPELATPRPPRRGWRMRRVVALCVLLVVLGVAGLVARAKLGYRTIPHTRIALRQPAQSQPSTAPASGPTEDWPQWRGPRGDGISREKIASELPAGGLAPLWSADVGIGYSSPVAVGGRVYLFTLNERKETLTAFDAATGRILWSDESDGGNWTGSYPGTRATPAIDGDAAYTYGGAGELTRHDLETGRPHWRLNVLSATGSENLSWGTSSSPLVTPDAVFVQSGKGGAVAVAVRKDNGSVLWQSETRGVGGYAHPVLIDVAGSKQLIVFGGRAVYAMDPATGRTIWQQPWETNFDVNSTTPVYRDGHLFVSSEYEHGSMMLRLSGGGAEKLWENKDILGKFPGMVLDGDALYANSAGTIKCMSWPDGKILWTATEPKLRLGVGGSIVRFGGDRLLTMSDRGKLTIARATPQGIALLSQAQALDGREVWSTPLLYGGRLYVKGDTEFVCFELSGGRP